MKNSHIDLLKNEFNKKNLKRKYSLRSFAKDLNCSPSWLSDVLKGKKGISQNRAESISEKIKLNAYEKKMFILSARIFREKNKLVKDELKNTFEQMDFQKNNHVVLSSEQEHLFSESYYAYCFLQFFEIDSLEKSVESFSNQVGITSEKTVELLYKLAQMGILKIQGSFFEPIINTTETTHNISSQKIKNHHYTMCKLAAKAVFEQSIFDRHFQNIILAFDSKKINDVKKFIDNFQQEFIEKFYEPTGVKNSVYSCSIQFFRLNKSVIYTK